MSAPWEKYQTAPSAPQAPGIIQGAPDPAKQAAEARAQAAAQRDQQRLEITARNSDIAAQNAQIANQLNQMKLAEAQREQEEAAELSRQQDIGVKDSIVQMRRVIAAAKQAKTKSNTLFATGFGAEIAKRFGGSNASDVAALLNTIGSNTAFDRLQRMREESKTGGALGAVSEVELALLRDSIASLEQSQSDDQFQANMDQVISAYQDVVDRLEGVGNAKQPTNQDIYANGVRFGDEADPDGFDRQEVLRQAGWPEGGEAMLLGFNRANNGNENITAADVQRFYDANSLPYPDGMDFEFAAQSLRQGEGATSAIDTSADRAQYDAKVAQEADRMDEVHGESSAMDLVKQGFTFGLMDESTGVGTAIGRALTGDFNIADNYALGRDAERLRLERARGRTGAAGTAIEVGGALATPSGALKGAMSLGQAARTGATAGGVGGFGYGEGAAGSATNALVGAVGGAALGAGGQKIGNALAQRAANKAQNGGKVQAAADDLGIDVIPAMTGGAGTQRLTGAARQGFVSDRPIAAQVAKMEGQGQAARSQIASDVGRVVDADDAGEIVRSAANVYSDRTSEIGGKLYARADKFAGDAKFPLPSAVQAIDQEMTQLAKAPGGKEGSLYKSLGTLKRQIGKGKFSVEGIRSFRTTLRNEISGQGLRGSPQDVAYNRVLKAAEEDMLSGLSAAGNDKAVGALKTATAFWRKRVETIDEVLEPVLGKNSQRSGEQVLAAVERLAKPDSGNASRLRQLMKAMPEEEASSVRATVIARMGRPTKGAADMAEEGGFSFNTFLTNWNNMTPRAKATMFPGESIKALNKLAQVSKGYKQAGGAMNASNTGGAVLNQGAVSGALWLLDPIASGAGLIGQYGLGKLLASPRFARWLSGAPKNASAAVKKRYVAQLGQIAKAQPALAGDLQILERSILKAANDNAGRMSAAAENSQEQVPQE